jgi:hypothetical protein
VAPASNIANSQNLIIHNPVIIEEVDVPGYSVEWIEEL